MNTPITDAFYAGLPREYELSDARTNKFKARQLTRRLELDRAALMEALVECMEWTHRAIDLEVSGSMQIAQKGAIELAESALAAARANFPNP